MRRAVAARLEIVRSDGYPRLSPFEAVRWHGETPEVQVGGTWEVAKHDLLAGAATQHNVLKKRTSPKAPGATSIVVELMCATLSDGVTTCLVAFVNGTQVADITDPVTSLPRFGWLGSLTVRGEDSGPTTVTATHFEERDLTL